LSRYDEEACHGFSAQGVLECEVEPIDNGLLKWSPDECSDSRLDLQRALTVTPLDIGRQVFFAQQPSRRAARTAA